jgi:hypothetical protein
MEACPSGCIYITNEKIVPFFFLVGVIQGGNSELEDSCNKNEIIGIESMKSSDEFVHVIRSVLHQHGLSVVVKIHDSHSYFVEKELFALNRLADFVGNEAAI